MRKFRIQTCPKCKKESENETYFLPCGGVIYDEEDEIERCPLCSAVINQDDPEYKVRYREEPSPARPKRRFENIKKWLKKLLH